MQDETLKQDSHVQTQLALHGAVLSLSTAHLPYAAYVRGCLVDLLLEPGTSPSLQSRLHWDKKAPSRWLNQGVMRHGRRLLQDDSSLLLAEIPELPGLQIEARWEAGSLEIDAYFSPTSRLGSLALRLGQAQARVFAVLTYYLIYFPLIYYLYKTRGWHLLHAGGVVGPAAAWILAGLPGSGKSTFTLALLSQPEMRLLSDNLLLYDERQVYAFPEPLHLSEPGLGDLTPYIENLLVSSGRQYSHGRRDFYPLPQLRRWQAAPEALFFLGQGERFQARSMVPLQALERLLSYDTMAKETAAYEQFAGALDLIFPARNDQIPGRSLRRREALHGLVQNLECAEIQIQVGSLVEAVEWVCSRSYKPKARSEGASSA